MSESRRESGIFLKTGELPVYPSGEYYAVFSGCRCTGRIIISVLSLWQNSLLESSAAALSASRASTSQSFYTPVGDTALPGRNGTRILLFKIKIEY